MGTVTHTIATRDAELTASDAELAAFDGQLNYSLTTLPDPLTISPASTIELADLIIVGSRIHPDTIETNQIAIHLPIGPEAWQLVLDYTGLQTSINLTGWTATPDPSNERILFKPTTGHATLTPQQGLTVQLNKLRINRQVGTAPVVIALNWRPPGTTNWRTEEQTLGIGKFPPGFYLRNLKATPNHIDNGDSVTLTWERSTNAKYTLLYEDKSIDVTNYSTFPVHNITRNTMFYLEGTTQQGTGSATLRLNTYVTVNKPDLEVGKLHVHDGLHVEKSINILNIAQGSIKILNSRRIQNDELHAGFNIYPPTDGILYVELRGTARVYVASEILGGLKVIDPGSYTFPVPAGTGITVHHQSGAYPEVYWSTFGTTPPLNIGTADT